MIKKLIYEYEEPDYEEEFKPIIYPGLKDNMYLISNYGRVYNIKKKIIMKTYFDDDNHEKITLVTNVKHPTKRGNKSKHYFIHRLMLWTFIGPPINELYSTGKHKNQIPCCNFIHNLEWGSVLENTNEAKKYGIMKTSGIDSTNRKYSEKLIREICSLRENGNSIVEILEIILNDKKNKKYSRRSLYFLIKRICYKTSFLDISSEYNFSLPDEVLVCDDKTRIIRDLIFSDKTNYEILDYFGYAEPSDNRSLYNDIIYQRSICKAMLNDYRKGLIEERFIKATD